MHVLALNPGSATLKFRLYALKEGEAVLGSGTVDHVAGETAAHAAEEVVARCRSLGVEAVGCRVVHGGEHFSAPTLVTDEVLAAIRDLGRLAPLHNPIAAAVLESARKLLPDAPAVA